MTRPPRFAPFWLSLFLLFGLCWVATPGNATVLAETRPPATEPSGTRPTTEANVPALQGPDLLPGMDPVEDETSRLIRLWTRYKNYFDPVLENVIELDLWGISTPQLPKGVLKLRHRAERQRVTQRYDDSGNKVPFAPELDLAGLFHVDLQGARGGGWGYGHTIQMSYGITDALDFYVEFPFQRAEVLFDVTYTPGDLSDEAWGLINGLLSTINLFSGGPPIDLRTVDGFWNFIEALGRPRLVQHYKSNGLDLGDIHGGFSWNYYKAKHFSAATTARVYFPTGWQPSPNNSIELFTGAGFPAGTASWGLSTTQGFDFRLPSPLQWVVFNLEFTYEYRFRTRRGAPTFPKRSPAWERVFQQLKQLEPEVAMLFPDLSDMGSFWHITYGHSFDGEIGVMFNPFQIIPFGVKYGGGWTMKPKIESTSSEFIQYVENVEIVGEQASQMLAFGTGISLIPFYIPVNLMFEYRIPLWGYGSFVIKDNWALTAELFIAF